MNTNEKAFTSNTAPSPEQSLPDSPGDSGELDGFAGSAGIPSRRESMVSSVTRHALNPPIQTLQLLLCGIDSLDLGLFVSWNAGWCEVRKNLEVKKLASQESTSIIESTDLDRKFQHFPSGKPPNYRYHVQFLEYHLYIGKSDKYGNSPNVYVSISATVLWHESFASIIDLLALDLEHFGGTIDRIQPSRCDLSVDFRLIPPPDFSFLEQHKVSRSRYINTHINNGILETYYSGSPGSPVRLRIYDKGKEIQKSNKYWFLDLWGIHDPSNVWRVEFQLRRAFLHQYRINTLEDLWAKIGTIWEYLTAEWFSLRLPSNDKTERRTIHPWWEAVRVCGELLGVNNGGRRCYDSDNPQEIKKILPHIYSRMITIAALSGIKNRKESIRNLYELLEQHGDDNKFKEKLQEKLFKLGYRGTLGGADYDDELPF